MRAQFGPEDVPQSQVHPDGVLRLDRIRHPFGPCPAALEAIEAAIEEPMETLAFRLKARLAEKYRLSSDSIRLLPGADSALCSVIGATPGPIVTFPPGASTRLVHSAWPDRESIAILRGIRRSVMFDPDLAADLPSDGVSLVESPADPLGTVLSPADAVRLARASRLLVIDERYAEFAGQSMMALAAEFDNIAIVRSFESWAGLPDAPCAWTVAGPEVNARLSGRMPQPEPVAIAAALATLDSSDSVDATVRLVREERSRLYRQLRKLSFLEPLPSWGPFVSARAAEGMRDAIVAQLRERGIRVHAASDVGLERYIRFGLGTRSAMERLRVALLDLAPVLVG